MALATRRAPREHMREETRTSRPELIRGESKN